MIGFLSYLRSSHASRTDPLNGNSISKDSVPDAVLTATNPEPALNDARRKLEIALQPPADAIKP